MVREDILLKPLAIVLVVSAFGVITNAGNLEEQIQQLSDMTDRRPVIRLNTDKFIKFVGSHSVPRNYSFVVMMTALSPMRGCPVCREAHEEFLITATSFRASPHYSSKKLFFGSVDFDDAQDVFNILGIDSAPRFLYFSEKGNFRNPNELNTQKIGFEADIIARWLREKTGMSIVISRPPNYTRPIMVGLTAFVISGIIYLFRNSLVILLNSNIWAFIAVSIVLIMTSGQMWNHIRGPPFMKRVGNKYDYIHGSGSAQFVIETYIVLAINAGLAIGMTLITEGLKTNDKISLGRKKIMSRVGSLLLIVCFSLLLSITRVKSYGYPYRLLF